MASGSTARSRLLADAEIEALAAVPDDKNDARRTRLSTTLHPCPMCLGATVVARVGHLAFGAYHPTWLGIEQLPQLNEEVQHRVRAVGLPSR